MKYVTLSAVLLMLFSTNLFSASGTVEVINETGGDIVVLTWKSNSEDERAVIIEKGKTGYITPQAGQILFFNLAALPQEIQSAIRENRKALLLDYAVTRHKTYAYQFDPRINITAGQKIRVRNISEPGNIEVSSSGFLGLNRKTTVGKLKNIGRAI